MKAIVALAALAAAMTLNSAQAQDPAAGERGHRAGGAEHVRASLGYGPVEGGRLGECIEHHGDLRAHRREALGSHRTAAMALADVDHTDRERHPGAHVIGETAPSTRRKFTGTG